MQCQYQEASVVGSWSNPTRSRAIAVVSKENSPQILLKVASYSQTHTVNTFRGAVKVHWSSLICCLESVKYIHWMISRKAGETHTRILNSVCGGNNVSRSNCRLVLFRYFLHEFWLFCWSMMVVFFGKVVPANVNPKGRAPSRKRKLLLSRRPATSPDF